MQVEGRFDLKKKKRIAKREKFSMEKFSKCVEKKYVAKISFRLCNVLPPLQ